jgi:hypothetical protein
LLSLVAATASSSSKQAWHIPDADCMPHHTRHHVKRKRYAAALPHSHVWIFTFLIQWF